MEKIELGKTGMLVSPAGLGCMGFTHAYGDAMEEEKAIQIIREAYEMGYNFFDTAEGYVGTNPDGSTQYNEELVGKALKDVRDDVVIATKFGVYPMPDHTLKVDCRPETIRHSLEESLKKLGTDHIDLYYQHRMDPKVEPEVVAGLMKEFIEAGKIRAWGISEVDEDYLRRAHAVCPVSAIQNRYSMMATWMDKLFPVCKELGITFVAFSPLANGFLSGKYSNTKFTEDTDYRKGMPQYTKEGQEKAQELLDLLERLAKEKGATKAQVSLAWMMGKDVPIIPIPGSRNPQRIRENLEAGNVKLSKEEIKEIDEKLAGMDLEVFGGHKG